MLASGSTYLRFLLGPSLGLLLGLAAMASHSATINFELLPDNSDPVDNLQLPINYVFQDGRTGLSFGFDTDGDNIADTEAVIEEHGNIDAGVDDPNLCVGYTAQGGNPKDHDLTVDGDGDGYGDGGRWFIREKKIRYIQKKRILLFQMICSPTRRRCIGVFVGESVWGFVNCWISCYFYE